MEVEYIDLADPEAEAKHADLLAVVQERSLPYPLVAINGQLRLAGSARYEHISPLVEQLTKPSDPCRI